jgi:hypothetical protein
MSQLPLQILSNLSLEQELILLLATISANDITKFAKKNGSKKYCRKGEQEVEQMALREIRRAIEAALSGDFSCYSVHAKRPQRIRETMLENNRILLIDTIISHYNSHYQNYLKEVLKGREELKRQICERENVEYKGIRAGVERECLEEKEFENVEISDVEKEQLKAELLQKYGIKPKPEPLEEEVEDDVYKPVNNLIFTNKNKGVVRKWAS